MHVQKIKKKNIKTKIELQVNNGCFMLSNIMVLFGLNEFILGFSPLFPLHRGKKRGKTWFLPLFPPYPGKKGEKGSRGFSPPTLMVRQNHTYGKVDVIPMLRTSHPYGKDKSSLW